MLAVNVGVKLVEPKSIQRSEGKAKRVVDLRDGRGRRRPMIEQLSVFLENKPGRLAEMARVLGDAGINMRAFMVADTASSASCASSATGRRRRAGALEDAGFGVSVTQVIAVEVPDRPAAWPTCSTRSATAGVNVEYAYCFVEPNGHGRGRHLPRRGSRRPRARRSTPRGSGVVPAGSIYEQD